MRGLAPHCIVLAIAALMPCTASPDMIAVMDIQRASAADVADLKRQSDDGWWLELGDVLVLATAGDLQATAASAPLMARHPDIDRTQLMLRARGCSEHSMPHGTLVAQGSRWELRLVDARERALLSREPSHAWVPATAGMTVARQARLDLPRGAAPAQPHVQAVVDRIDGARWFADVETLAGWDRSSYATTSLEQARDWIAMQFDDLGLATTTPGFTMTQPGVGPITRHNVIGTWTGTTTPDRWIVVGAHYDARNANPTSTTPTPGAEDNASGCAGVIELARALLPSQPEASILFMCYAGEEQGLLGSQAHVDALDATGDLARVDAALILDMIGYSATPDLDLLVETSSTHAAYLQRFTEAAATYVPDLMVSTSTMPFGSDHMPYLGAGRPSVLSIENDWDIYPHYHEATDTPANMGVHAQAMGTAVLRTNAAVLADLAGIRPAPFADGFEDAPP